MTAQEKAALGTAVKAFIAALSAGVPEDVLLDALFDTKIEFDMKNILQNQAAETRKEAA
jgi:hypothetical protein